MAILMGCTLPSLDTQEIPTPITTGSEEAGKPFDASARADMILRSSDMVDFFVLEGLLRVVSPVFETMITSGSVDGNGMKVVSVTESSHTLRHLLLILYHLADTPDIDDGKLYFLIGETGKKYALQFVESRLRTSLRSSLFMTSQPLRAFAIAMKFGWMEEARLAAVNAHGRFIQDMKYCSELEGITGTDLFRLLEHGFKCVDAVDEMITSSCQSHNISAYYVVEGMKGFTALRRIQEVYKSRPRGSAIKEDTGLDLAIQHRNNFDCGKTSYYTSKSTGNYHQLRRLLADRIDETVMKEGHLSN
ncbi:hypothetical protein AMATHDRAFT_4158 [Amanita thiersii Skay4041]|uniref:BTB domain-containing protein n=1 Tax=Amanita thiersii Skay4041 TaxID=703135 RepID=A0A2A9NRD9_9AGAR|nr:hypothetical protein AMATHDRAFT_4158 [Amanita thiersii Skay4041]